jgi:hypothetical protein
MKLLTTLLIAVLAALAVYSARRRIMFALKTGAIVYVVVLFLRLAFEGFGDLADRWDNLVWPVFITLLAWLILWFASTRYEARKRQRRGAR